MTIECRMKQIRYDLVYNGKQNVLDFTTTKCYFKHLNLELATVNQKLPEIADLSGRFS